MIREFEGKTEQEAIEHAVRELDLDREKFDVEIVESEKKGLFRKGLVKIRIHLNDARTNASEGQLQKANRPGEAGDRKRQSAVMQNSAVPSVPGDDAFERKVITFVTTVLEKMGFSGKVTVAYRRDYKLGITIDSPDSGIIIGKKGKNLDALQLLVNVFAGQLDHPRKVVIDSENYRIRHEEHLVKLAYKAAEQVKETKRSRLLEPMNPFERRLIHTALNDIVDIDTRSEGEGLYKQVRIFYKGMKNSD